MPADPWVMAATVVVQGLGILALWLRLRWQIRQEQVRAEAVVNLAEAMRNGGEADERRPDGSRLKLSVNGVGDGGDRRG
ncbi:MAG TPA: hypothetical protein VFM55_20890 [Micromonosporaceae bacterium]|nr:hypothetical protein [Micromonosporaceae bacterium]